MKRLEACGCCPAEADVYECVCCESTYFATDCYEIEIDDELVTLCSSCVEYVD